MNLAICKRTGRATLALFLGTFASASAQPTFTGTLVNNTNQPGFTSFPVVEAAAWQAAPFQTGADPSQLTSIVLNERSFMITSGTFWVTIYGDNHGLPGAPLVGGLLNGPSTPNSWGMFLYSATQPLALASDSVYWLVAASDDVSPTYNYGWGWSVTTNYTSSVGWGILPEAAWSPDQGATWNQYSLAGNPGPLLFAINGAIVPEPSSAILAGLGLVALLTRLPSRRPGR